MRLLVKFVATAVISMAVAAPSAFASCDDGEIVIKFSHVTNTDKHPKGLAAALFEKRVNEEMNGKVCLEVFPNSTLYNDNKVLEALLLGNVQMAAPSLSKFEKYTKQFRIFDLPFLFKDIDAVDAFQASENGQNMLGSMKKRGIVGLSFWHNGMKQLSANKPLLVPADAEGLKFRIQASDVLQAQFEALNANPQKMAFSEVYGALQTKVIDGQENSWSNIYGKKFFEVQDGITESNHGVLDYLVVTSREFWSGLPDDVRDQLQTILNEVSATRNAESTAVNATARQEVVNAGTEVRELNAEQREAWVAAMKPVWKQFEGDIGADLIEAAAASGQ